MTSERPADCPSPPSVKNKPPSRIWLYVGLILLAQWIIAISAISHEGITLDEPAHLVGGLIMLENNDYRFNPENGILPQKLAALPAWLGGMQIPPETDKYYVKGDVWMLAYKASFETPGQSTRGYYMAGRAIIALFGIGVSLMVFLAARSLWGTGGGFVSLILCAASPNLLAHSAQVTSDVASTLCMPLAAVLYWRMLERPDHKRIALTCVGLAAACLAKLSAVFLAPCFMIMLIVHAWSRRSNAQWGRIALANLGMIAFTWLAIWAAFGFHFTPGGPGAGTFYRSWNFAIGTEGSTQQAVISWLHTMRVFPEAFLYGIGQVSTAAATRLNFFQGELKETGSAWFFPYLFLTKTPVTTLIAIAVGCGINAMRWRKNTSDLIALAPWLIWAGVYGAAIVSSNLNIGHRHMLPIYPTLFVLAGACWSLGRFKRFSSSLLVIGTVLATALSFPHYLAYFNHLDGGPNQAWRRVADSSLDWGQGLPALKEWLQQNRDPHELLYLSYFGCDSAAYYKIQAVELPKAHHFYTTRPWYELHGGIYAISTTMLTMQMGRWPDQEELNYPVSRLRITDMLAFNKETPSAATTTALGKIEDARARRLNAYLRTKEPIAQPAHAILVYRLTETEARAVETGAPLPLDFTP